MVREDLIREIEETGSFSFARSGGPGGQNVNKVNTKVLLTLRLDSLNCLGPSQKALVRQKLKNRLNARGELFIQIQQERSQLLNRTLAVEQLSDLILQSIKRPKVRKKTRPTRSSVEKRLSSKKRNATKKQTRGRYSGMD